MRDDQDVPQLLASAVLWTDDESVRDALADRAVGRVDRRGQSTGIVVAQTKLRIPDAATRQAEFEKFLHLVAEVLIQASVSPGQLWNEESERLAIHVSLSGPEMGRGVLFDPESLRLLIPFAPSIYLD